jgi:hypothetical protein
MQESDWRVSLAGLSFEFKLVRRSFFPRQRVGVTAFYFEYYLRW